ncbi:platelet endothelial aggregation receptor 1-like isoform X2 [Mobula hypostoma]|uniref:platelet endothelial aggregation receptor 1-like isoform X2 n=1 Tax=Mobula hypostoma TaxID=723540 RepID=UPI002FC3DE67
MVLVCSLVLFYVLLPSASPLMPNDPNVCSSWERYTVSRQEEYAIPQVETTQEDCDDPRSNYRCTRHRITYRQMYRPGVQTDYRKRTRCCQGYYERRGICVAQCSQECVHGRCVGPDRCQCEPGWRGSDCSSNCSLQTWGPACADCGCKNGGICDPTSGRCSCPSGYLGASCEDTCPAGTYGLHCLRRCRCRNQSSCDPSSGQCWCAPGTTGALCERPCKEGDCGSQCPCQYGGTCTAGDEACLCLPGWMGSVCALPCPQGTFGQNCSHQCQCHNGGQCDHVRGQCRCAPGYTGDRCEEECPQGTYGLDCAQTCDCLNQAQCMHVDGACLCAHGFEGARCSQRHCQDQLYGHQCNMQCTCDPLHTQSCHPVTGVCTCDPGWSGPQCNESCAPTLYGTGCLKGCLCLNGGKCNPVSGQCACTPGYTGSHCSEVCPLWTYGQNCSFICQCQNAAFCSPVDGSCHCLSGWTGWDCTVPCDRSRRGLSCNNTCLCANGATCHPVDRTCTCGPGWQGPRCEKPCLPHQFGPGCTEQCSCNSPKSCNARTGSCQCPAGRTGPWCEEVCELGRWGPDCAFECRCLNGGRCHWENGNCLCAPGYSGPNCQHPDGLSLGATISIVILLAVVVFLLSFFICLRHKYGGKATRLPPVTYTAAVAMSNGEYVVPDVPQSNVHYYANPSYHTLPQRPPCQPPLPELPGNRNSTKKTDNLFWSKKNLEVESPGLLLDCNATLPADWKHSAKHKELGMCPMDRSYSCSNNLPKYINTVLPASGPDAGSNEGSLSSGENVYATIQDLPSLEGRFPESSYVEMGSRGGHEETHAGNAREKVNTGPPVRGETVPVSRDNPGHYSWPRNSDIPSHYDLPTSHPHCPSLQQQR